MSNQRITIKYILAVLLTVLCTWLIHEFAHWLTSTLLGHNSVMSLNSTSFMKGEAPSVNHRILISASGPLITILQGLTAFLILRSQAWNKYIYIVLFTAFYMRFLAGLMNVINPNDEGRISLFLDLGLYTLPLLVSAFLFLLTYSISKQYKLNKKFLILTTLFVMLASSCLILADQFFGIRIL